MLQLFWGSIFLLFDINVSSHSIDILPDFIGWLLMVIGLKKLSQHSRLFSGVEIVGILMILISILQTVISFIGNDNFVYTYISNHFGISNTDSVCILNTAFWALKMIVITVTVLALVKIKDRISDTKSIKRLGTVWFIVLGTELFTLAYKNFIMNYLPDSLQKAILQILAVGVIFFRIWFIFSELKLAKDYKPY